MQLKKILAAGAMGAMMALSTVGFATTLADFPAPFVEDGTFNSVIVVGAAAATSDVVGAIDLGARLAGETTETKELPTSTVTISDGDTEKIALGSVFTTTGGLDTTYTDDDMSCLQDTTITLNSTSYSVHDEIQLTNTADDLDAETSLSSNDDDYEDNIFLEIDKDAIKYCYVFDKTVNLSKEISTDTPLEISFMGKTLKITGVTDDTTFTAQVGTEVFLTVDESVEVEGKTVTLKNVGSSSTCTVIVDVDGTTKTVTGTKTVNGLEVQASDCFYEETKAERSATLIIGTDAVETYTDADEFIDYCTTGGDPDCEKTDPDWIWDIKGLEASGSGATNAICIENDFIKDDDNDEPVGVGEYYWLPYDFAKVGIDSLTVADDDYMTLTVSYDSSIDLSNAGGGTSDKAIVIEGNVDDAFNIDYDEFDTQNLSADVKTKKMYLKIKDADEANVYYVDSDNKVQIAGSEVLNTTTDYVDFADINYKDTKGSDIVLRLYGNTTANNGLYLGLVPTTPANDQIWVWLGSSAGASGYFDGIGDTANLEETNELYYGNAAPTSGTQIGTKDEDHRTMYGVIIKDPKSHGSNDEEVFMIPADQVKVNAVVACSGSTTTGGGTYEEAVPIETPIAKLDTEVTSDDKAGNLILVGGPAVNTLVKDLLNTEWNVTDSQAAWLDHFSSGEAMIKLVEDAFGDGSLALIVAGTDAADTVEACHVLQNYDDYATEFTDKEEVKVTTEAGTVNVV